MRRRYILLRGVPCRIVRLRTEPTVPARMLSGVEQDLPSREGSRVEVRVLTGRAKLQGVMGARLRVVTVATL